MVSTTCDRCGKGIIIGFVCQEDYLGYSPTDRANYSMQQQTKTQVYHFCKKCMDQIIMGKPE